jgi:ABC-type transporter Mla subunit MlaD
MKRIALIVLTAIALLVAGCGNSKENDYVTQVNAADAKITAAVAEVAKSSSSQAAAAKAFDKAADRLDVVVKDYQAIDPPDNAAGAHKKTIAGISGLADLFRDFADQTRAANTNAEAAALQKRAETITSTKPFRQLAQARAELEKAGYKVQDTPG